MNLKTERDFQSEEKKRENGMEKFEETTARNLSNLMKAQFTDSKQLVNPRQARQKKKKKKPIPTHIIKNAENQS